MNVSLYQAAAAMNAHSRWQEVIAENLTAGTVPGHRKQNVTFAQVEAGLAAQHSGGVRNAFYIPSAITSTTFQQGIIRPTGEKLDFAIDGPGFFEVQLPNGEKGYTRDGQFQLNAQGQLTTKRGHLVLSDSGPVQVDPGNPQPVTISPDGNISQGDDSKGKLRIAEFADPNKLVSAGAGYYIIGQSGLLAEDPQSSNLRQGYLEVGEPSPSFEMSQLITSMRAFEANQKVITMQDERLGRAINELGHT